MFVELIGYLASIVILIGFTFKGESKIRTINMIGSLLFIVYGLLIKAYPVALLNALTIVVNIRALLKTKKEESVEED